MRVADALERAARFVKQHNVPPQLFYVWAVFVIVDALEGIEAAIRKDD